jgi:hypothetical protein
MPKIRPGPLPPEEVDHFLETFLYSEAGVLVDEILRADADAGEMDALLETAQPLAYSDLQRTGPHHPAHVAAGELLTATGSLGCLHAYFFHGCRWDEGWAGYGGRIHRVDFKRLARRGPPLHLHSRETRVRRGAKQVVIRYEFRFLQEGELVYRGDQTAMFLRG